MVELKGGGEDDDVGAGLEQRGAVAEVQAVRRDDVLLALLEDVHLEQAVAHRLAVGPGVADDGAAHGAGDVGREGEAGEPLPGEVRDQGGQLHAGLGPQDVTVQRRRLVARQHGQPGDAGVADEHVGAAAQHNDRQPQLPGGEHGVDEHAGGPGADEELGRAADTVRRHRGEGHALFETGQLAPEHFEHTRIAARTVRLLWRGGIHVGRRRHSVIVAGSAGRWTARRATPPAPTDRPAASGRLTVTDTRRRPWWTRWTRLTSSASGRNVPLPTDK
ncbi:MAG: hypothetical protein BWY94_01434 [Actinobacteria bacterium ADurb.BinA094]|nr:MAG: hypothetical protein BWY94_01434 [Actinobacteria bacterium ADurb.BinA094]